MISIEEFQKLDLRVGTITKVEQHPNADKLYVLKVNFKEEERQIVAGLKQYYTEKELLNKQITVIMNLEPAKLRGIESQGMLLATDSKDGRVAILTPDKKIENNSKIR